MTGMLASVNSLAEALVVLEANVDIVDLKQPKNGSLGALDSDMVREIVAAINGRRPVSATIGDLPMHPELVLFSAKIMAGTGADFLKIGFFPGGDCLGCIAKLSALASQQALVAVLFADTEPDFGLLKILKNSGFKGVMLDTLDKRKGSLTNIMPYNKIDEFVSTAKEQQLLCGLAGSLRRVDIGGLIKLQPDYLGFRGALCKGYQRSGKLNEAAVVGIKKRMERMAKEK